MELGGCTGTKLSNLNQPRGVAMMYYWEIVVVVYLDECKVVYTVLLEDNLLHA